MSEVDVRAGGDALEQSATGGGSVNAVPADVRHLLAGSASARRPAAAAQCPGTPRSPGPGRLGAAREQPLQPDADPEQRPRRHRAGRGRPGATPWVEARVEAKCPTPGTIMPGRRQLLGPRRVDLGADGGERLAHRGQVAGAVVDQRNHSRPFVFGSIFASRLSWRRPPQRAGERLEAGLDLLVVGAAVDHLEVHVGRGGAGEALEEIGGSARSGGRRPAAPFTLVSTTCPAAPQVIARRRGLVHRHHEVASTVDAARRRAPRDRLAERDADVLHGVVLIDVEIAGRPTSRSKPPWRATRSSM